MRQRRGGAALEENVREIKAWEEATRYSRSKAEQLSGWIASTAATGPIMLGHLGWFGAWIAINTGWIPGLAPFDPFPFPLLTLTVSLEAIFLALFVLSAQNQLTREADRRSNLDLQIDLLAEREMTAVLQLLRDIVQHLHVKTRVTSGQVRDLAKKTDIHGLAHQVDDMAEDEGR